MRRLHYLAFGAIVITSTTAYAQAQEVTALQVRLGQPKAAPLCPEFCAPRRVTSPEQATVGERDVLAATLAAAAGSKLHVDSHRAAYVTMNKLPSVAPVSQAPLTMTTRKEFRPALDPVLAEPTTQTTE